MHDYVFKSLFDLLSEHHFKKVIINETENIQWNDFTLKNAV